MSKHLAYDHECEGVLKVLTDVERNTLNVGCTIHDWRSRGEQDEPWIRWRLFCPQLYVFSCFEWLPRDFVVSTVTD